MYVMASDCKQRRKLSMSQNVVAFTFRRAFVQALEEKINKTKCKMQD